MTERKRNLNLNVFRIYMCLTVFFFHALSDNSHFSFLWKDVRMQMSAFFILSGFLLYYNYEDKEFQNIKDILKFYKHRIARIFPYFLIVNAFFYLASPHQNIGEDILFFPMEITMLFITVDFPYIMNAGTWFISCIFICYLLFPYLLYLIKQISYKCSAFFVLFIYILLADAAVIGYYAGINLYHNAFLRLFEFISGIVICKIFLWAEEKRGSKNLTGPEFVLIFIYFLVIYNFGNVMKALYHILIFVLIYVLARNTGKVSSFLNNNKVIKLMSDYSMDFWIASFFTLYFAQKINSSGVILLIFLNLFFCILIHFLTLLIIKFFYSEKIKYKLLIIIGITVTWMSLPYIVGICR